MTKQHDIQQLQRLRFTLNTTVDKEQKKNLESRIEQIELKLGFRKEKPKIESGAGEKPVPKEEKTSKKPKKKKPKKEKSDEEVE